MCVLDAVELAFQLSDRFAVCIHLFAGRVLVLVELIDDQSRVSVDIETFNTELDRNAQTMYACFVFSCIIRCWEMNPEDVPELLLRW